MGTPFLNVIPELLNAHGHFSGGLGFSVHGKVFCKKAGTCSSVRGGEGGMIEDFKRIERPRTFLLKVRLPPWESKVHDANVS